MRETISTRMPEPPPATSLRERIDQLLRDVADYERTRREQSIVEAGRQFRAMMEHARPRERLSDFALRVAMETGRVRSNLSGRW
jgi:hypothetical protein